MPVHHRLRFLTFPMRTSRLCSLWPDMRSLRFRRVPFGRDVAFDPGGATASRIAMPHILPSTVPSVSASATFFLSWLNPTPHPIAVYLRIRRRRRLRNTRFPAARYHLTGAGLSPAGTRQLRLTHRNRKFVDSPLEGTGFEPSVPLLRNGLSAVAERRCRTDKLEGSLSTSRLARRAEGDSSRSTSLIFSCLRINLSQFQQPVRHWSCSDTGPTKAWHHSGEVVSTIESVLELGEVTWDVLAVDEPVGSYDRSLDVSERGVDPLERWCARGGRPAARLNGLVGASGIGYAAEAGQAIADHLTRSIEYAWRTRTGRCWKNH